MAKVAKAAKKPRKPRDKAKQGHLDGMAPPSIPSIDQAAENYYEVMMDRVKLSKEEDQAKDALINEMNVNSLQRYEYDGKVVMLVSTSKVKIKKTKEEKAPSLEE